ncbi:MAG: trypsin-like peptidase domain-containing protein [Actinomycetota bacterium]|nr:trypsin-like peptidase domain-containing protein [Actinomycetota bacterium]
MTDEGQSWPPPASASSRPPAAVFPVIPAPVSPPPAPASPSVRRTAVVALAAALVGGLLASGITLAATDEAVPSSTQQAVAPAPEPAPLPAPTPAARTTRGEGLTQVEAVAAAVLPAVVQIELRSGDAQETRASGNGSGVIYRSDGHILTNNHVVEQADGLRVKFADGEIARAEVVGTDPLTDLAVVKVDSRDLPAIQVGDIEALRVGALAVAIGSPFGLEGSVTAGVVSALNRPISVGDGIRLPDVIQTDAPINPGNSGGALVGSDGRLIGINSAILTAGSPANAGVGFAIPANIVVRVADELIESGEVVYPLLGVTQSEAVASGEESAGDGAVVGDVEPGGPADEGGLRQGDVITRLDDTPIRSFDDLILAIRQRDVGDTVRVTYRRQGDEQAVDVILVERPG